MVTWNFLIGIGCFVSFFFWLKHTPPLGSGAFMSRSKDCSEITWRQSVAHVRDFLNHVVQEISWSDTLNGFNHCLHFPYFMTHFTYSMPISSIGGMWSNDLWNPKYAAHIFKVTVAVDMLGNIVWILLLGPGTSADVLIWDRYGPSRTRGDFFDFEVGGHDGAYKGRVHVSVLFIGRKNDILSARQQSYNDVHGWYRARIEQLFAHLWHWGLNRNIWLGGPNELHQSLRILFFASGGKSVTLRMDRGNMFPLMFGRAPKQLLRMTRKMMLARRLVYVHCAVKSTLPQNVVNVICIIVWNVLTCTHVGTRLFIEQSCLFNVSEQIWWNKVLKVIQICFSCTMLCVDGLLLHLVGKRQLLVHSGAPYGNGKRGDSIGESHHKSSAQGKHSSLCSLIGLPSCMLIYVSAPFQYFVMNDTFQAPSCANVVLV